MLNDCPFCHPEEHEKVVANLDGYIREDRYPVSPGHLLIIPKRHVSNWFELTWREQMGLNALIKQGKRWIIAHQVQVPDGYNIGINIGPAAGQTVMHVHIHLIPRYVGDMDDPRGGVRGVIPGKQSY